MSNEIWAEVDRYINDKLVLPDAALTSALQRSESAGLPAINVSPSQGKLLHLLAKAHGARAILEIGTLGGYSTIWLARALPENGRLTTLEADPKHAEVARENIEGAGLSGIVDVRLGRASDTLPKLAAEGRGPYDLIFIDADKPGYPDYFAWALQLSRQGDLDHFADNVIRMGAVTDPTSVDLNVQGIRRFFDMVSAEPRVSATAIQTVGSKGYDGFALIVVTAGEWRYILNDQKMLQKTNRAPCTRRMRKMHEARILRRSSSSRLRPQEPK